MKTTIALLFALFLFSCQKSANENLLPECKRGMEISHKYNANWYLLRIDTLATWRACGRDLDTLKAWVNRIDTIDFRNCPDPIPGWPEFKIEIRSYIILN